jgi:magnesium-protoporphyrin O-methyltransferase
MTNVVENKSQDKAIVKEYFNATGFERWRNIYGNGDVNKVQIDIRQ